MHIALVKIGNSQGVRLPRAVIEQAGLERDLDLEVVDGAVIIRSAKHVRAGWAEAARDCHARGGDAQDDWDAVTGDFAGDWK
jgi:antitoxin MazE